MTTLQARKETMLKRLAELKERLAEIDDELEKHASPDWEDMAIERETDEVLEGMGLSGQAEIKAINAALERIDAGEYGYCTICGDKILEDRLDVVPYTPFCKTCARDKSKTS